ncbi:hypothetical protein H4S01_006295, partial [Coemansia sp. RSA 2610]
MYLQSHSSDFEDDGSNCPRPSRFRAKVPASSLMEDMAVPRSSASAAGPSFPGPGAPQRSASGPQPYTAAGGAFAGPGARPPPPQAPAQGSPPNNGSGPQAYAPQSYAGAGRPPPPQQPSPPHQQQYAQSVVTQSMPHIPQAYTPYPGVSSETSSIYSGPHPGHGHTSSTINTTSGAYYAPTTNSSSSAIPEGYGYPQQQPPQPQQPQQGYRPQQPYQQQQPQQPYQQQPYQQPQQPYQQRPQGMNSSSVYTATSYSPTQGPAFNHNNTNVNLSSSSSGQPPVNTAYAPSIGGPTIYGRPPYAPSNYPSVSDDNATSRVGTAGKLALGALAAGALAYGVHEYRESSAEEEKKEQQRKKYHEEERIRRESDARQRREEEETQRRNEYDRWRREEDARYYMLQQQQQAQQPQRQHSNSPSVVSHHTNRPRPGSRASTHSSHYSESFRPPDPFGRPPYSFDQRDVRLPDPSRNSENSKTATTYPELWQKPSDPTVKIGTILALKHVGSGRHLRTDRSHSTESGSNQQL